LDLSQPFVDAMLPGGHRLHVVLDGITRGFTAVNIRKFVAKAASLDDLVTLGTLDERAAAFLRHCVLAGLNIVVSGGTQAGKPTNRKCAYWSTSDCPVLSPPSVRSFGSLRAWSPRSDGLHPSRLIGIRYSRLPAAVRRTSIGWKTTVT